MLAIKELAFHRSSRNEPTTRIIKSFQDLPGEILSIIVEALFFRNAAQGRTYHILAVSRVCHSLRQAALPLLFQHISCVVRKGWQERPHPSFANLVQWPALLQHVRILSVRPPLADPEGYRSGLSVASQGSNNEDHPVEAPGYEPCPTVTFLSDLETIKISIGSMPGLQQIRYQGSFATLIHLLEAIQEYRRLTVIGESITADRNSSDTTSNWAAEDRAVSLLATFDKIAIGRAEGVDGYSEYDLNYFPECCIERLIAARVRHFPSAFGSGTGKCAELVKHKSLAKEPSLVRELDLQVDLRAVEVLEHNDRRLWGLKGQLATSHLRRLTLSIDQSGDDSIRLTFDLKLPRLTVLRLELRSQSADGWLRQCRTGSTQSAPEHSDVLRIDYDGLPALRDLQIDGICKHVALENIAGPLLTSLKLHSHSKLHNSTDPEISQRTSAEILALAQLSPRLRCLQLDIGRISNLWKATAIPGVDVNVQLYQFLSALSNFKHLRTLRLFPPYFISNVFTAQGQMKQQPINDGDAVGMFLRLRDQIPTLETLAIWPSDLHFFGNASIGVYDRRFNEPAARRADDFASMAWEVFAWGEQTILTTRQARKTYRQRQVWVGQRRLRTEVLRDAYSMCDNGVIGGSTVDDEQWLLDPIVAF